MLDDTRQALLQRIEAVKDGKVSPLIGVCDILEELIKATDTPDKPQAKAEANEGRRRKGS